MKVDTSAERPTDITTRTGEYAMLVQDTPFYSHSGINATRTSRGVSGIKPASKLRPNESLCTLLQPAPELYFQLQRHLNVRFGRWPQNLSTVGPSSEFLERVPMER
ncbi:Hypothetical predicted protein [Cloeon dipterum]|uniref:Uncharacterized protein n=1 Tax=Cloeon dipterum TaxID=197152 RepID=A0A8S1C3V1_9INSE|nr:Hypothetical predicted protein [Cloeon dipterum]